MQEKGITKNRIIAELTKSPHGDLKEYLPVGQVAAKTEPEFFSHLIAWDRVKGQIRDSKVALPLIALMAPGLHPEFVENALAHFVAQGPRELLRAYRFALQLRPVGYMLRLRKLIEAWLRDKEGSRQEWDRIALQHRETLKELYSVAHVKPGKDYHNIVLNGKKLDKTPADLPATSVFSVVARLKTMDAAEAGAAIMHYKIPFLIALGALEARAKETDLVLALINAMTPTEVVTNTKMLEKMGVKTNPALRGAFEEAITKASKSTKNVLKTSRAAEAVEDAGLKQKLQGLQDKQLASMSIDGNWLVLGDRSGSMRDAIEISRHVSGTLAKMVAGKVWLVFFDDSPMTIDVTGMSLDQIMAKTKHVRDGGSTSIGCGLQRMLDDKAEIDGIAIVSDGGENATPYFHSVYKRYAEFAGKEPPVYLYHCGSMDQTFTRSMKAAGFDLQVFDLANNIDYYSLPNLVSTMRTNRYSLCDEVMAMPLLTLKDGFKSARKEAAYA